MGKSLYDSFTGRMLPRLICLSHRYIQISENRWECHVCKATKEKINSLIEYRYSHELPVHPSMWGKLYYLKKVKEAKK